MFGWKIDWKVFKQKRPLSSDRKINNSLKIAKFHKIVKSNWRKSAGVTAPLVILALQWRDDTLKTPTRFWQSRRAKIERLLSTQSDGWVPPVAAAQGEGGGGQGGAPEGGQTEQIQTRLASHQIYRQPDTGEL